MACIARVEAHHATIADGMSAHLVHSWVARIDRQLYVWCVPPEPTTLDLEQALAAIRAWIRELDEPYGWITDPRNLRMSTVASQRRILVDHLRAVEPYSRRYCAGMATVVTNPLVRGIGTAVAWLYDYPFPVAYAGTMDEAEGWARAHLATRRR